MSSASYEQLPLEVCLSLLLLCMALAMGTIKAADCSISTNVDVCDICGAPGFEECLAVCSRCMERAEHVYCMQTLCDAVPLNWVCEGCQMRTVLETSERDSCANLLIDKVKENENKKARFSQSNSSAGTSERHQKHDSEEFQTEISIRAEHLSSGVLRKLSFLILSAEEGLPDCTSDENSYKSNQDCSGPAAPHDQLDLERVCHGSQVDGLKTATNLQLNDSSTLDAPQHFARSPVKSGALEHPPPTSSNPHSPTSSSPSLSRSTEHGLPLKAWDRTLDNAEVIDMEIDADCGDVSEIAREPSKLHLQLDDSSTLDAPPQYFTIPPGTSEALEHTPPTRSDPLGPSSYSPSLAETDLPLKTWNSNLDNAEVIDMEIDVDSGDASEIAREPVELLTFPAPRQADFPWAWLKPPFPDSRLPPFPCDSPPLQSSPPATSNESGAQEWSFPPLPPDSPPDPPPMLTPCPQPSSDIVDCIHSLLPPLPSGSPPAQPSPPSTPGDQTSLDNDSHWPPSAPSSPHRPTCPQSYEVHAPESNLDSSIVSKCKSSGQENEFSMTANLESSLASRVERKRPRPAAFADNGQEGDDLSNADLEGLASQLDKKRSGPASYANSMITCKLREAPRYGSQSDIFEILLSAPETSRSKTQAPLKKQGLALESQKRFNECADKHKHLCSSDQQVKNDEKNASSVIQRRKISFKIPERKLSDNVFSVSSKIRTGSGLESNKEPHLLPSTTSSSELTCPLFVEQAILKQGKEDTRLVPWVPLEDCEVAPPSSNNASSCLDRNGVCARQDIIGSFMDKDLVHEAGGDGNVDDVSDTFVRQNFCLSLFPALESSSALDRTGILADLLSEHGELLSDQSWQMMPLVQQLEEPWYKPPLPNLNEPVFPSSLNALHDKDFALSLRLPEYRKHGNIWISIDSDTRTCYDENVKLSLSCFSL